MAQLNCWKHKKTQGLLMKRLILALALISSTSSFATDCAERTKTLLEVSSNVEESMENKEAYLSDVLHNLKIANAQLASRPHEASSATFETFEAVVADIDEKNQIEQERVYKQMHLLTKGIKSFLVNCVNQN
tara:strand:- start:1808 stop:2203 length:396 start_codon:yes stop_codon:yes gene_type:complete